MCFLYPLSRGYKKTQTESFQGVPRIVAYAFPRVLLLVSWPLEKNYMFCMLLFTFLPELEL